MPNITVYQWIRHLVTIVNGYPISCLIGTEPHHIRNQRNIVLPKIRLIMFDVKLKMITNKIQGSLFCKSQVTCTSFI